MSVSLPCASIVIFPAEVANVDAASPVDMSSNAVLPLPPVASSQATPLPVDVNTCPSEPCEPPIVRLSVSNVPSISTSPLISKVAASSSPVIVMFLAPVKSLLLSTTIAFEASTVPAVATST